MVSIPNTYLIYNVNKLPNASILSSRLWRKEDLKTQESFGVKFLFDFLYIQSKMM